MSAAPEPSPEGVEVEYDYLPEDLAAFRKYLARTTPGAILYPRSLASWLLLLVFVPVLVATVAFQVWTCFPLPCALGVFCAGIGVVLVVNCLRDAQAAGFRR